jgi:hypothetical protein
LTTHAPLTPPLTRDKTPKNPLDLQHFLALPVFANLASDVPYRLKEDSCRIETAVKAFEAGRPLFVKTDRTSFGFPSAGPLYDFGGSGRNEKDAIRLSLRNVGAVFV